MLINILLIVYSIGEKLLWENALVTQNWATMSAKRKEKEVSFIKKTGNVENWQDDANMEN